MIVVAVSRRAAGFYFHAARAEAVGFNHVVAQGEAHSGRQRMHDIFHPFSRFFLHHAAAVADKHGRAVGRLVKEMTQHIAVGRFHLVDKTLLE